MPATARSRDDGSDTTGSVAETLSADATQSPYSVDSGTLADGTYTVQAVQRDDVGNTTTSAARTFTVDTTAPAPHLTAPTNGGLIYRHLPRPAGHLTIAATVDGKNVRGIVRRHDILVSPRRSRSACTTPPPAS